MGIRDTPLSNEEYFHISGNLPDDHTFTKILQNITRNNTLKELIGLLSEEEAVAMKRDITIIRAGGKPRYDSLKRNWYRYDR